nr:proline-rich receptor-like protein kinase PERK10 [Penaeus vannamei]
MTMAAMSTTMGQQYRFNTFSPMSSFNSFNSQHMNWAPEPMTCSKVTDKLTSSNHQVTDVKHPSPYRLSHHCPVPDGNTTPPTSPYIRSDPPTPHIPPPSQHPTQPSPMLQKDATSKDKVPQDSRVRPKQVWPSPVRSGRSCPSLQVFIRTGVPACRRPIGMCSADPRSRSPHPAPPSAHRPCRRQALSPEHSLSQKCDIALSKYS